MSPAEGGLDPKPRTRLIFLTVVILCVVAFASFSVGVWYSDESAYGRGVAEDNLNYAWTHPIPQLGSARGFYLPPGGTISFDVTIPEDGNYTIAAQVGFVVTSPNGTAELTIQPLTADNGVGKSLYNSTYVTLDNFYVSFNLSVTHCTSDYPVCWVGLEIDLWANRSNKGDISVAFPWGLTFEAQRCTTSYSLLLGTQTTCEPV